MKNIKRGLKCLLILTARRQIFEVISRKEKIALFILCFLFLSSLIFLSVNFYFKNTEVAPAPSGVFTEGVVGSPRFINPIYTASSDVDRDLMEFIFSGLMKYDSQGKIIPDLARTEPKIEEGGTIYEFCLKENLFWSDGEKLTADDVIFTIKTIQNPDIKSPLRVSWLGVEIEKISDEIIRFKLKNPYFPFLETLTLKIIPEHIWQDIPAQNFPLVIYNLKPIGSGPYKLEEINQDELGYIKSLTLVQNPNFFGEKPNIRKINFLFFDKEKDLIEAANLNLIQGFSLSSQENLRGQSAWEDEGEVGVQKLNNKWELYSLSLPRYFAVFFNPDKSKVFSEKEVRKALNYGTNKKEIIEKNLFDLAKIVDSPILPEIYGFNLPTTGYEFNPTRAEEILEKAGFVKNEKGQREKIVKKTPSFQFKSNLGIGSQGTEVEKLQECLANPPAGGPEIYPEKEVTGYFGQKTKEAVIRFQKKYVEGIEGTGLVGSKTRAKLNELCSSPTEEKLSLSFSLVTVNQPILVEVASQLKNQWEALGVKVEIISVDISQLEKDFIKKRGYEALLFGEDLGLLPDPFAFWHSSQKKDPGLNLASYENKDCDKLLEEARQSLDERERREKLEKFQNLLIEDVPVIFLYSQDYLYFVSKEIKGIGVKIISDPSKRFSDIEEWYIKTKRVWK